MATAGSLGGDGGNGLLHKHGLFGCVGSMDVQGRSDGLGREIEGLHVGGGTTMGEVGGRR